MSPCWEDAGCAGGKQGKGEKQKELEAGRRLGTRRGRRRQVANRQECTGRASPVLTNSEASVMVRSVRVTAAVGK